MRDPSSLRLPLCVAVGFTVLWAVSPCLSAQVELTAQLGFENRVTSEHYAPIRVEIHGLSETRTARLTVVQPIGNAWRGKASAEQDLGYAVGSDGVYSNAVPVYDPVNPVTIELRADDGTLLADTRLDLRATLRTTPFLVLDKQIPRFDEDAALIDVLTLPRRWWAFDCARSVWLASPLTTDAWTSISQWVVAGGSLVLLTGTDFYRMDSPELRWLLPISDPHLVTGDVGTPHIEGILGDATVELVSDEGYPLLIQAPRGAGDVSLITVAARSLDADRLRAIADRISPSGLISVADATSQLLGEQPISTLSALDVIFLTVLMAAITTSSALIGRRNWKLGWSVLVGGCIAASVSFGYMSNPVNVRSDLIVTNTALSIDISVPLTIVSSSMYAQTSATVPMPHETGMIPEESLPRTLNDGVSYDFQTFPAYTDVDVQPGETRSWRGYGADSPLMDVEAFSDSSIRIRQFYPFDFEDAWVIIDGMAYPIPTIVQGVQEYSFDPQSAVRVGVLAGSGSSGDTRAATLVIRDLRESLPLQEGVWLIAVSDRSHVEHAELTQKVRDLTVVVVSDEGVAHGAI